MDASRREVLTGLASIAAGTALAGCSGGDESVPDELEAASSRIEDSLTAQGGPINTYDDIFRPRTAASFRQYGSAQDEYLLEVMTDLRAPARYLVEDIRNDTVEEVAETLETPSSTVFDTAMEEAGDYLTGAGPRIAAVSLVYMGEDCFGHHLLDQSTARELYDPVQGTDEDAYTSSFHDTDGFTIRCDGYQEDTFA